jgi:hypothetical protein
MIYCTQKNIYFTVPYYDLYVSTILIQLQSALFSQGLSTNFTCFFVSLKRVNVSNFSSFYLITQYANILKQSKSCEYPSLQSSAISFFLRPNIFLALHSNMLNPL